MIPLRSYQSELVQKVDDEWAHGARNVIMRADTGAGKTVMLAYVLKRHRGASCVIAHRQELVGQISMALARCGLQHNIIASAKTRKAIVREHIEELGRSYLSPNAPCAVASIDTLIRADGLQRWFPTVTLWVVDEAHHVLRDNKWGSGVGLFTNPLVRGLMPTATPSRADGSGLGRNADGVADALVEGPPMRWLIEQGYLCDYDIVCPTSDLDILSEVSASGDWSPKQLKDAARRSHIVGDVVDVYKRFAMGKLTATFATDIDTACEISALFNANGVPAAVLSGKTEDGLRRQILRDLKKRKLLQIVTVDIISEGFDLPALEVVQMARPTASYGLYAQQFGRALRTMAGKDKALIIDQVGNTIRHQGTPDKPRIWTLDRRDKKSKSPADVIPLRICIDVMGPPYQEGCLMPYERFHTACPHCGLEPPPPAARAKPDQVEGDLGLLDAEALAVLRGLVIDLDKAPEAEGAAALARGMPEIGIKQHQRRFAETQDAQGFLRATMGYWGGLRRAEGLDDRQIQKRFFLAFGIDVLTAQTLKSKDALALNERITNDCLK